MAPPPPLPTPNAVELFTSVQLTRTFEHAPPPAFALLFVRIQLSNVPSNAPPPYWDAALSIITQLETVAAMDSHNPPPPPISFTRSPVPRVAPFLKVKPLKTAPFVK